MKSLLVSETFNPVFYKGWTLIKEIRQPSFSEVIEYSGFFLDIALTLGAMILTIIGPFGLFGKVIEGAAWFNIFRIIGTIAPAWIYKRYSNGPEFYGILIYVISYAVVHILILIIIGTKMVGPEYVKGGAFLIIFYVTTRLLSMSYIVTPEFIKNSKIKNSISLLSIF